VSEGDLEELVKTYRVSGVIELGLNEIGNELFGGLASAGPNRLEAAVRKGFLKLSPRAALTL